MSIGKTVVTVAAVALAVGVAVYVMRHARKVQAARKKAGFSADRAPAMPLDKPMSIDVDTGEPVLKAE